MADRGSARRRAAEQRAAQLRADARRRRLRIVGVSVAVVAVIGAVAGIAAGTTGGSKQPAAPASSSATALGPEGMPLENGTPLADLSKAATGSTVDGIRCSPSEQVAYHIHSHLAVYVDGTLAPLAPGIGIVKPVAQQSAQGAFYGASQCYYWLHVHAQDGVIHVESPTKDTYVLGQLFAEWGQPLTRSQVGPATGTETVFVDGTPYTGDPAAIPLAAHAAIQIDVGTVVPFQPVDWSHSQL